MDYSFGMSSFRLAMGLCLATGSAWAAPVEFNRDVRAILSKNCFACHGKDAKHRKGKLRLDAAEDAFASKKGVAAIVAGNVAESELWARINSGNPDEVMPPPETKKSLTAEEKQTLKRWIEQGASTKSIGRSSRLRNQKCLQARGIRLMRFCNGDWRRKV